jgi:hypothetical protein
VFDAESCRVQHENNTSIQGRLKNLIGVETEHHMKPWDFRSILGFGIGVAIAVGLSFVDASLTLAQGAPGVTDKEILIGSCSALEGPSRALGVETVTGAKTYFSMINA